MDAPICPNCGTPITRALDLPYGWWEWDAGAGRYRTGVTGELPDPLITSSGSITNAPRVFVRAAS